MLKQREVAKPYPAVIMMDSCQEPPATAVYAIAVPLDMTKVV